VGTWKILDIVDEEVNGEIHILLEYCGSLTIKVDDAWYLLKWIA